MVYIQINCIAESQSDCKEHWWFQNGCNKCLNILPGSALAAAWANCSSSASNSGSSPKIDFIVFSKSSRPATWLKSTPERAWSVVCWEEADTLLLPSVFSVDFLLLQGFFEESDNFSPFSVSVCELCFDANGALLSKSSNAPKKKINGKWNQRENKWVIF